MNTDYDKRERDILAALEDSPGPLTRLELAAACGLSSWQTKQSILTLREQGLVEPNPGHGYRLVAS